MNKFKHLTSSYWIVFWLGCCLILGYIFYSDIQHQKRIEKIFDKYYQEINRR